MVKTGQNEEIGGKRSKVVKNGQKWSKMIKKNKKWSKRIKMVKNGQKWSKMVKTGMGGGGHDSFGTFLNRTYIPKTSNPQKNTF